MLVPGDLWVMTLENASTQVAEEGTRLHGSWPERCLFVVEGISTCGVHFLSACYTVSAAFEAGNLITLCKELILSHRRIVMAGDDDHQRERQGKPNVGTLAAVAAATPAGSVPGSLRRRRRERLTRNEAGA
jgi:hypothetical protein